MLIPILELVKLKPQRDQVRKILNLDKEMEDPLAILQNICHDQMNGGHAPILLSLVVNDLILHNCVLDYGALANVMPLKVMNQLELQITRPYRNACGFESKSILVHGLIKDVKVAYIVDLDSCTYGNG